MLGRRRRRTPEGELALCGFTLRFGRGFSFFGGRLGWFRRVTVGALDMATLPTPLGGLGLESLHDFAVDLSRIGRGDGSTDLAVTMHLFRVWTLAWSRRIARQTNDY